MANACVSLPIEFADDVVFQGGSGPRVEFRHGTTTVRLAPAVYYPERYGFYLPTLRRFPKSYHVSLIRLEEAIYRASDADFRWTMSLEELAWHQWTLGHAGHRILMSGADDWVELLYRDDFEGMLCKAHGQLYLFECSTPSSETIGGILFCSSTSPLDPVWVRKVCRSLRFSGEAFREEIAEDAFAKLIDIPGKDTRVRTIKSAGSTIPF